MNEKEAFEAIEKAGFKPVKRETYDDKTEIGKVVRTAPAYSDEKCMKSSEMTVFVSPGVIETTSKRGLMIT